MSKAFDRIATLNQSTLMIVDALNLGFRWKHAKSTNFVDAYIDTVKSLQKSYKAGNVIIVCDEGSSSYRKAIYPEYKQNRKDKYETQTEKEKEEFLAFFEEFNNTMEHIKEEFPLLKFPKCEADDIAAYIVKHHHKYDITDIWLISSDKDWDLLISDNVSRFSYVTRKETRLDNWFEHYDCAPEDYISIKCLQGDTGDNIKGIEGIGPKRALELVKAFNSAIDIYANLPIKSKYKYIQALNEQGDIIPLNYRLMDLLTYCEEALGINTSTIDKALEDLYDNS
jgi:5'-3' exonuclease